MNLVDVAVHPSIENVDVQNSKADVSGNSNVVYKARLNEFV